MAKRVGNNGNHGKKGRSGRKSAYVEASRAEWIWEIFQKPLDKSKLAKKILTGTCTPEEIILLKIVSGNDRILAEYFKKLFPDSLNVAANMNQKQMEELEEGMRKILEMTGKARKKQASASVGGETLDRAIRTAENAVKRKKQKPTAKRKIKRKKK